MDKILDGELEVRGRRPDPSRLEYEPIDRSHWRSSWLTFVEDQIALWKMKIIPRGGVEMDREGNVVRVGDVTAAHRTALLDYDSLTVDAYQFEKLWPHAKRNADEQRRRFLREARRRGLDRGEIQRLSDPPTTWWISVLFLIIAGLLVLSLYLLHEGKWRNLPGFRLGKPAAQAPHVSAPVEPPVIASPPAAPSYPRIIPLPDAGELPTAFAGLSNADLKATVARITGELRSFDASYQRRFETIERNPRQAATPDEQRAESADITKQIVTTRNDEREKYNKQFTEVRPLYFELLDRLSELPPPSKSPQLPPATCSSCTSPVLALIYSGSVTDKSIIETADYLDALSALLPP